MFKRLLLFILPISLYGAAAPHCPFYNPLTITSPSNSTSTIDYNCDDTYYLLSDKSFIQKTIELAQKPPPLRRLRLEYPRLLQLYQSRRLRRLQNISLVDIECYPGIKNSSIKYKRFLLKL